MEIITSLSLIVVFFSCGLYLLRIASLLCLFISSKKEAEEQVSEDDDKGHFSDEMLDEIKPPSEF